MKHEITFFVIGPIILLASFPFFASEDFYIYMEKITVHDLVKGIANYPNINQSLAENDTKGSKPKERSLKKVIDVSAMYKLYRKGSGFIFTV